MIQEIRIEKMEDLIHEINQKPNHFVYRGHADSSWKLESSIERILCKNWTEESVTKAEETALEDFQSKFHIYNNDEHIPNTKLSWLSMLQHYGVPTRFIDFTTSPYVALYFALEEYNPASGSDLAIYAVDYRAIMNLSVAHLRENFPSFKYDRHFFSTNQDRAYEEVIDSISAKVIWITEPSLLNKRLDRQAGTFLFSGSRKYTIEESFLNPIYDISPCIKYIIPSKMYGSVFALLRKVNINGKTIYGDLPGLGHYIKMDLIAHCSPSA